MNIDITELMKTGLFELHYMRQGDSEEWSIIPAQTAPGGTVYTFDLGSKDFEKWGDWESDILDEHWTDDIPWDKIPDEYDYVAMDRNGTWFAYENWPELGEEHGEWRTNDSNVYNLDHFNMPAPPHWTESLVRRPQ